MKEKTGRTFRRAYGIFFSLFACLVGVLFVWQAWSIYLAKSNEGYTRAIVWKRFQEIAVPVVAFLVAFVGNIVLAVCYPEAKEKPKAQTDAKVRLARYRARYGNVEGARKEGKKRLIFAIVIGVVALLVVVATVAILLVKSYTPMIRAEFFTKQNGMVDRLVRVAMCALSGAVVICTFVLLYAASEEKEIKLYKAEALARAKRGEKVAPVETAVKEENPNAKYVLWSIRGVLFVFAVVCIVSGVANGGMHAVLQKAINVCTQCIGIG